MSGPVRAYHFVGETLRDGRPVPPNGEWFIHEGKVEMCNSGLHASKHPFDALTYAPGNTLCLVECEDIEEEQDDKLVCCRRKIIQRIDAEPLLREFARWCALQVIHLWDAPAVVREYLETGDESLRVAAAAAAWDAWYAARAAGYAAADAGDAARAAAGYAAADAGDAAADAGDAARAAAEAAAGAARAAARAAALAAQRDKFQTMVDEAFGGAA